MTNKEASEVLQKQIDKYGQDYIDKDIEALQTAIKLKQQDILDEIRAKIKSWQIDIHDNEYDADEHDFVFEQIYEIIDEYKAESEET